MDEKALSRGETKKKKRKRLKKVILSVVSVFVLAGVGASVWAWGTSSGHNFRRMLAGSILCTQHPQYARFLLSAKEIAELQNVVINPPSVQSVIPVKTKTVSKEIESQQTKAVVNPKDNSGLVQITTVETSNYTAKIMRISDPTTIHLVTTKYENKGQPLSTLIKDSGAIAGVNAGGFYDPNGDGSGGQIIGLVISDGVPKMIKKASWNTPSLVCGFTKSGEFITGTYSVNQLLDMGVTQAVTFGPQLIVNGRNVVTSSVNSAFGWAPRTAIGQASDGSVYMIITDGRFYWNKSHRGASMEDMADLFKRYNVENAFALDGGGSTTMIDNGQLELTPATNTDVGMRYLPNAFVVIPN